VFHWLSFEPTFKKIRRTFFFEIFATRFTLTKIGPILKLNLGGDRFLSQKSWKTAKNRQFIGPLGKLSHRKEKTLTANLNLLIPRIMSTFRTISIYDLRGDRF
jgi:hypothetical protein